MLDRINGLWRRGWTSLRTRGLFATWARMRSQFRRISLPVPPIGYVPTDAPFSPFAVPASDAPVVSIVIPVYNHATHTLNCLRALAAHPPATTCEIIVVDDGSSDETVAWMPMLEGLHYHRRTANGGFIAACNDGATLARGEHLVFLNNDTVPQPGWLDSLLDTFTLDPNVGLAGSQLIYPDGRLQEAGGIVFRDGSAWNYGRFESPCDPRFAYCRETDYCSGAAIMIASQLFHEIGGFDERYSPAYYEDTDLAFAVRAHGYKVVYQPASRVIHAEGITAGTDTNSGIKSYQRRNHNIFYQKWAKELSTYRDISELPSPKNLTAHAKQILVVDALTPEPDKDSGSLRLVNLIKSLKECGMHVVFLPSNRRHAHHYTNDLQKLGVEVWYAPFAGRPPAWLREHGYRFHAVMLSRHYVASEFYSLVRRYAPQARLIFDTVDLHYLRELRGAALKGNTALSKAASKTRTREIDIICKADVTLVVSPSEKEILERDAPGARVEVLSNIHTLSNIPPPPLAERNDLVFVGGFRHPPNIDAALWFGREIFPTIRTSLPNVVFHCIGAEPPEEVLALQAQPGILVHGHVPDITPYMDGARVAVAPLRFGAGVKGKVNLSMAHGQPVVATTCAVEGMHLIDGHDVLVANDASTFAAAVVRAYTDPTLWELLSRQGRENVATYFSPDAARKVVERVFLR